MESKLTAKAAQKIFDGDGGSYYSWLNAENPILSEAKLGGGKLLLHPLGLALPHYADSSKVGYVLQGAGRVGVILSKSSAEIVLKLKKGDIIPLHRGEISWWFNDGDTDFTVVFLGETSKAYNAGEFKYFFLAGTMGILNGFSTEFLAKAWNLKEEEAKVITKTQNGVLIVKLNQSQSMPEPCKTGVAKIVTNTEKRGQLIVVEELALPGEVGLSTIIVKLVGNATYAPEYSPDSAFQMIYIVKGAGRVQVVGIDGKGALDVNVEAGQMFVVPRFFVVSMIAGGRGMEWFSIITTQQPMFHQLAGDASVYKALSPQVIQASLNISPELEKRFRAKLNNEDIVILPN